MNGRPVDAGATVMLTFAAPTLAVTAEPVTSEEFRETLAEAS